MKLIVKSEQHNDVCLRFPATLLLNGASAAFASGALRKKGLYITARQMRRLFRIIRRYKESHPDWTLVDACSAGGEHIMIKL